MLSVQPRNYIFENCRTCNEMTKGNCCGGCMSLQFMQPSYQCEHIRWNKNIFPGLFNEHLWSNNVFLYRFLHYLHYRNSVRTFCFTNSTCYTTVCINFQHAVFIVNSDNFRDIDSLRTGQTIFAFRTINPFALPCYFEVWNYFINFLIFCTAFFQYPDIFLHFRNVLHSW